MTFSTQFDPTTGYLPAFLSLDDEPLFECTGDRDPLQCYRLPLFPRRADLRGVRCDERVVETVGEEVRAA